MNVWAALKLRERTEEVALAVYIGMLLPGGVGVGEDE